LLAFILTSLKVTLAVTLQFAKKGGLTQDEIENVQQEYGEVLSLM
jgi:MscS family membrane protein